MNQSLVEATRTLKEQRKVIRERLAKVEAERAKVSEKVFAKVQSDYQQQLDEASQALLAKKAEIDRELATLHEAKAKVSTNVEQHREEVEELKLRKTLGEFNKAEFDTQFAQVQEKLTKFETVLTAIITNIDRYEKLFADEPDLMPDGPQAIAPPQDVTPGQITSEHTPVSATGEEYQLEGSEGEYFKPHQVSATRAFTPDQLASTKAFAPGELDGDTEIAAAPKAPGGPTLAIVKGKDEGSVFQLQKKQTTIGRGKTNNITLKEPKISREHAVIQRKGKKWMLRDLHSSNGVFLNGARIEEAALNDGDQIQIGDFVLEFRPEG